MNTYVNGKQEGRQQQARRTVQQVTNYRLQAIKQTGMIQYLGFTKQGKNGEERQRKQQGTQQHASVLPNADQKPCLVLATTITIIFRFYAPGKIVDIMAKGYA